MNNSLLIVLAETLSPDEQRRFIKYLPSETNNPELLRLGIYLFEKKTLSNPTLLKKKTTFEAIFGKKEAYNDLRFRKMMEQIYRIMERFLRIEHTQSDSIAQCIQLAHVLSARGLEKHFNRLVAAPLPLPASEADWTTKQHIQMSEWNQILYDYKANSDKIHDSHLYLKIHHHRMVATVSELLFRECIFRTNQKFTVSGESDQVISALLGQLSSAALSLPLIHTLSDAWQTLVNPDNPAPFVRFKAFLLSQKQCFSVMERRELFLVALNHCSKRYNSGQIEFLDYQLEIYEAGLKDALILDKGWVSGYTFTNICTLALIGKRNEWLHTFIETYGAKVHPRDREGIVAFNQARLYYIQKKYKPALRLLQRDLFEDVLMNLSVKVIQAKCFYELQEYDLLDAHLEAFKKFIHRQKGLSLTYSERYLNFVIAIHKLLNAGPNTKHQVLSLIQSMGSLAEKEWLILQGGGG